MTSVSHECGQWQDERTALSSTLTSDVNESEHVDDKGEDDVLCDPLSRHVNDVGSEMFRDAGEVVGDVQQIDDTKVQNCRNQASDSSTRPKNPGLEISYMHVMCVIRLLSLPVDLRVANTFTLSRGHTNVICVTRLLLIRVI